MRTVKLSKPEGELFASPKSDKNFAMRLKILKALDRETAKIEIEWVFFHKQLSAFFSKKFSFLWKGYIDDGNNFGYCWPNGVG